MDQHVDLRDSDPQPEQIIDEPVEIDQPVLLGPEEQIVVNQQPEEEKKEEVVEEV